VAQLSPRLSQHTLRRRYKGSNLALIVELLAGPLVGAAITDKLKAKNWGNLVVAVSPDLLGAADFEARVQVRREWPSCARG
jgi:LDH2 family malate/lactate/ureidoglycolate dehydrogenase